MASQPYEWVHELWTKISSCMHRNGWEDDDQNFITHDSLANAWSDSNNGASILDQFRRDVSYFSTIDDKSFFKSWIRVVSILIWIRYDGWTSFLLKHLRYAHIRPNSTASTRGNRFNESSPKLRDENLPFTRSQLGQHLFQGGPHEDEIAKAFYKAQFAFIPIVLEQNQLLDFEEKNRRLPLIEEGPVNETGSYGFVTKVKIAKRHYLHMPNIRDELELYPEEFDAARKEFDVGPNFAHEHENLRILQSSDLRHNRIVLSFASVIIGPKYNLFFRWADLDLERFLHGSFLDGQQESHISPSALLKEILGLLDALKFLHESIQFNGTDVTFCHLDLKPNNILVARFGRPGEYPIGKFMITDFGISSTEPRKHDELQLVSARELYVRTNRTTRTGQHVELERFPGPYQPPEAERLIAESLKQQEHDVTGEKSDIWSFGCVILSVLAFAIGGPSYTCALEQERIAGGLCPDGVYRRGYFYRCYKTEEGNAFQIDANVVKWFDDRALRIQGWFLGVWNIVVEKMLRFYPRDRKSARIISARLKHFIDVNCPTTNIWSHHTAVRNEGQLAQASPSTHNSVHIRFPSPRPPTLQVVSSQNQRPFNRTSELVVRDGLHASISRQTHNSNGNGIQRPDLRTIHSRNGSASTTRTSATDTTQTPTSTTQSAQSGSEPMHSLPGEFITGQLVTLDTASEKYVKVSTSGSPVLYVNQSRARVFEARTKDEFTTFNSNWSWCFPRDGKQNWDETHIAGRYLALRKKVTRPEDDGQIMTYDLGSGEPFNETSWTDKVTNHYVNAMCISRRGFVAFRTSREVSVFTMGGTRCDLKLPGAPTEILNGIKDVTFGYGGNAVIAVSSYDWFVKDLTNSSAAIKAPHKFCRHEYGSFKPLIIPFENTMAFLIHDKADPGRFVMIQPSLNSQASHREDPFYLDYSPCTAIVTPDSRRLVYVTRDHSHHWSKYKYFLRSRAINPESTSPVAEQDASSKEIFSEKKECSISITVVQGRESYIVLAALSNGKVKSFALQ